MAKAIPPCGEINMPYKQFLSLWMMKILSVTI